MPEQRPIWRGHLRLALVPCPIGLYSANHDRGSLPQREIRGSGQEDGPAIAGEMTG